MDERAKSPKSARRNTLHAPDEHPLIGSPAAVVQMQRVVGNRAMRQMLQRAVDTETLDYTADKTDGVTHLKARIGAASLWGRGSKAQEGQPSRIDEVGSPLKGRYVGGHMLNQEVGGDGTWDNMIVQSHTSNTNMNLHDNIIKRLGYVADQLEFRGLYPADKEYEYWVEEEIHVNDPAPDDTENFPGERHVPASLDVTLTPRKRHKTTNEESDWTGHGETINNPYHVVNVPPYPPAPDAPRPKRKSRKEVLDENESVLKKIRLKRGSAYLLTQEELQKVEEIGPKTAENLWTYFQTNKVSLEDLSEQSLTGLGFNKRHLQQLMHLGFE